MYRATVEQVNGLNVRAGGKWLTCIGNRPVKVGDKIWTDGRCVYGNYIDCQQPIVITKPLDENVGIPIAFAHDFYTYTKSLSQICSSTNEKTSLLFNSKRHAFIYNHNEILAANTDNFGNVYGIFNNGDKIKIVKNGETIKMIQKPSEAISDAEKLVNELSGGLKEISGTFHWYDLEANREDMPVDATYLGYPGVNYLSFEWFSIWYTALLIDIKKTIDSTYDVAPTFGKSSNHYIEWAFIENETNWSVVLTEIAMATKSQPYATNTQFFCTDLLAGTAFLFENVATAFCDTKAARSYLINNDGSKLLFNSSEGKIYSDGRGGDLDNERNRTIASWFGVTLSDDIPGFSRTAPVVCDFTNMIDIKFPLHDDFYFVINYMPDNTSTVGLPAVMNATIYFNNDIAIFTGNFYTFSYFSVCRIKKNTFLLTVNPPFGRSIGSPKYYDGIQVPVIKAGLYLIEKGSLTEIKAGYVFNQCLRPMKHYKNWWQRIQPLD